MLLFLDEDLVLLSPRFFLHGVARFLIAASIVSLCALTHVMFKSMSAVYSTPSNKMLLSVGFSVTASVLFFVRLVIAVAYVGAYISRHELFDIIFGRVGYHVQQIPVFPHRFLPSKYRTFLTILDLVGEALQFISLLLIVFFLRGLEGPTNRGPLISVACVFSGSIVANFFANIGLMAVLELDPSISTRAYEIINTVFAVGFFPKYFKKKQTELNLQEDLTSTAISYLVSPDLAGFMYLLFTVVPLTFSLVKLWIPPSLNRTRGTLNRFETLVLSHGPNLLLVFLVAWSSIFLAFEGAQRTCAKPLGYVLLFYFAL